MCVVLLGYSIRELFNIIRVWNIMSGVRPTCKMGLDP